MLEINEAAVDAQPMHSIQEPCPSSHWLDVGEDQAAERMLEAMAILETPKPTWWYGTVAAWLYRPTNDHRNTSPVFVGGTESLIPLSDLHLVVFRFQLGNRVALRVYRGDAAVVVDNPPLRTPGPVLPVARRAVPLVPSVSRVSSEYWISALDHSIPPIQEVENQTGLVFSLADLVVRYGQLAEAAPWNPNWEVVRSLAAGASHLDYFKYFEVPVQGEDIPGWLSKAFKEDAAVLDPGQEFAYVRPEWLPRSVVATSCYLRWSSTDPWASNWLPTNDNDVEQETQLLGWWMHPGYDLEIPGLAGLTRVVAENS